MFLLPSKAKYSRSATVVAGMISARYGTLSWRRALYTSKLSTNMSVTKSSIDCDVFWIIMWQSVHSFFSSVILFSIAPDHSNHCRQCQNCCCPPCQILPLANDPKSLKLRRYILFRFYTHTQSLDSLLTRGVALFLNIELHASQPQRLVHTIPAPTSKLRRSASISSMHLLCIIANFRHDIIFWNYCNVDSRRGR